MTGSENVAIGVAGVDVVKAVIRIHSELGDNALMDGEPLGDSQVCVEEAWASIRIGAGISNHIEPWEREQLRLRCPEVAADRSARYLGLRETGFYSAAGVWTARCC